MIHGYFEKSLRAKFFIIVAAILVVCTVVAGIVISLRERSLLKNSLLDKGKSITSYIAKISRDSFIMRDSIRLDGIVSEANKDNEIAYTFIEDANKVAQTSQFASINYRMPGIEKLLSTAAKESDLRSLATAIKRGMAITEIITPIKFEDETVGMVIMGLSESNIRRQIAVTVFFLVVLNAIMAALIASAIFLASKRLILNPLAQISSAAKSVAAGDLSRTVDVHSSDEVGELAGATNRMVGDLRGMIGNVRKSSDSVDEAAQAIHGIASHLKDGSRGQMTAVDEAASSVNEMHFTLKEIAGNVEELNTTAEQTSSSVIETSASIDEVARTMNELSTAVEETSTAITQMSAAIREIAESVAGLSSAAEATASSAGEISASVKEVESSARQSAMLSEAVTTDARELGMRSIEKAIDGMRLIDEETRRTAEVINRLGGRAENIGSILNVINDITDKTSLLALNAAILAAQAGEHGKGFAVVAGEIRELANRTASSTQEIGGLIKSVQKESREAVAVMQKSVTLVEDGTRLTNDAGEALRKILERAGQSRDMSGKISRAAAEQTVGIKQMSEAVERINGMAHQIARATGEQRTGSEQIIRAAERMKEIARFVKGATAEQVKAVKDIAKAVETISTKIGMVHRASGEVRTGSDLIVKAIEQIKSVAKENVVQAGQLGGSVEAMTVQAASLKSEIERFRV